MTGAVVKLKLVGDCGAGRKVASNRVLAAARSKLNEVVVLGYTHDGGIYAASSSGPGDTLWLIEHAKKWLLDGCPADD